MNPDSETPISRGETSGKQIFKKLSINREREYLMLLLSDVSDCDNNAELLCLGRYAPTFGPFQPQCNHT